MICRKCTRPLQPERADHNNPVLALYCADCESEFEQVWSVIRIAKPPTWMEYPDDAAASIQDSVDKFTSRPDWIGEPLPDDIVKDCLDGCSFCGETILLKRAGQSRQLNGALLTRDGQGIRKALCVTCLQKVVQND